MKLNVFHKVTGLVLAGLMASAVQAQNAANVPDSVSGTYALTYAYAQASSPFTNGTAKTFVINGATDTLCVDGVSLGTGTTSGTEIIFSAGGGIYYALSMRQDGSFNEFNVNSPSATSWKGQFIGSRTSTSTTCVGAAPTLTSDQEALIDLAAGLYPDLFASHGDIKSTQGYTYLTFTSGVSVGFKDGSLYLAGGPFGTAPVNKGTIAQVTTALTNARNSVAITPTTDMTNLFTLAAQAYPTLFSNGTSFQTSADGYLYKYFSSGIYAAIKNGAVYVKGGSYGNVYTSIGAINSVLTALNAKVNGGGVTIPQGDYDLVVTGTFNIMGFSYPFSFNVADVPAPNTSDQDAIEDAFVDAIMSSNQVQGVTINSFTYNVKSNTANLVEFDMSVAATINVQGAGMMSYNYTLNYKYTK